MLQQTWKQKYAKVFGANLKKLRVSKNLTQRELSIKSGVSLSHVSRIERGVRSATLTIIRDLSIGLKVHPKILLEFKFEKD
jgi:transcriptional regulator with XRE-family HTH domain